MEYSKRNWLFSPLPRSRANHKADWKEVVSMVLRNYKKEYQVDRLKEDIIRLGENISKDISVSTPFQRMKYKAMHQRLRAFGGCWFEYYNHKNTD